MTEPDAPPIRKQVRGQARDDMRTHVADLYKGKDGAPGLSVRAVAGSVGRSYGFAHRILTEAVDHGLIPKMRERGGAHRRKTA